MPAGYSKGQDRLLRLPAPSIWQPMDFPARYLATAIGFTQCFGMLGGAAGQFAVAPLIHGVLPWQQFWIFGGIAAAILALIVFFVTPGGHAERSAAQSSVWSMFTPYKSVLSNPQSYLCGFAAGLLFLPTTVGDMIWGVSFLREGWHIDYAEAVNRAAMVPLGWVIGCPLLGYLADHFGRRKPVLIGGASFMLFVSLAILYLPHDIIPTLSGRIATGHRLGRRDDPLYNHQGSKRGRGKG